MRFDLLQVYVVFTERQPATAGLPEEEEAGAAIQAMHHDMIGSVLLDDRYVCL